jgi:hypothetical protein
MRDRRGDKLDVILPEACSSKELSGLRLLFPEVADVLARRHGQRGCAFWRCALEPRLAEHTARPCRDLVRQSWTPASQQQVLRSGVAKSSHTSSSDVPAACVRRAGLRARPRRGFQAGDQQRCDSLDFGPQAFWMKARWLDRRGVVAVAGPMPRGTPCDLGGARVIDLGGHTAATMPMASPASDTAVIEDRGAAAGLLSSAHLLDTFSGAGAPRGTPTQLTPAAFGRQLTSIQRGRHVDGAELGPGRAAVGQLARLRAPHQARGAS